jgi:glycosyltransferase involved in cell wall biosynthesis
VSSPPKQIVILPSYNTGTRLREVVSDVLRHWRPVLVVIDGSTDGSATSLDGLDKEPALTVLTLPRNSGKGAAVLAGASWAHARGFTHALVMDADGQHPAGCISDFMTSSRDQPDAMVLGRPIFPANMPTERRHGRKLSIAIVWAEILGIAVVDPLFGFRIYPLAPLLAVLGPLASGRRYDFDTAALVRLIWSGVRPLQVPAPVLYFSRAEGGVSHFRYGRDNVRMVALHARLMAELLLWRWPAMWRLRRRWRAIPGRVDPACLPAN